MTLIVPMAFAQTGGDESLNDPNQPPAVNETELCKAGRAELAMPLWPKGALRAGTTGWTVVRYDLDGSGRAQNMSVEAAAPPQTFNQSALFSIKRSKFTPGISTTGCKTLIVFSKAAP
ncbi:MAG TPA: TonB family protein [Telluria sp.]